MGDQRPRMTQVTQRPQVMVGSGAKSGKTALPVGEATSSFQRWVEKMSERRPNFFDNARVLDSSSGTLTPEEMFEQGHPGKRFPQAAESVAIWVSRPPIIEQIARVRAEG